MVSFGMETGNAEMLKRIRKGATLEQARRAAELCKQAGVFPHASFVVGLPGESPETLRDTAEFSASLDIIYGFHILTPFPGTTVREEVEKYDLEILTDDWTKYDANRAIIRTSRLSPQDIEKFVDEFNGELDQAWQKMVENYHNGVANIEETLRVAGHYRMKLVYKLLSEDIIERYGAFPLSQLMGSTNGAVDVLCEKIGSLTDSEPEVIDKTIKDFCSKGYLKSRREDGKLIWYWTHSNKVDRC